MLLLFITFTHCRRMDYTDAIDYLKQHNITKPDGTFYEFGEVSYSCSVTCN